MFVFVITSCFLVVVQPCMELIPVKKNRSLPQWLVTFSYVRASKVSMWKKSNVHNFNYGLLTVVNKCCQTEVNKLYIKYLMYNEQFAMLQKDISFCLKFQIVQPKWICVSIYLITAAFAYKNACATHSQKH